MQGMLDLRKFKMRGYQEAILKLIGDFFKIPANKYSKLAISSPTGTGKGIMQLMFRLLLLKMSKDIKVHLITTRLSIIINYLKSLDYDVAAMSAAEMRREAKKLDIYTYGSYRNLLVDEKLAPPNVLLVDECHHLMPNNILTDDIMYFMSETKIVGFTATFQRATAKATKRLHDSFDKHLQAISIPDARKQGFWKVPNIITKGLIDDDVMKVSKGKFEIRSVEAEFKKLGIGLFSEVIGTVKKYQKITNFAPCIVEVPSVEIAQNLVTFAQGQDLESAMITHKTPDNERYETLDRLERGEVVLFQVSIVSEGFDLPDLAVYIDLKPKNSVVDFMQSFGRITRPSTKYKEKYYICFNRNISRHAYNFEGEILPNVIKEAQDAFDTPPKRQGGRVFGFEKMGKFKPIPFTRKDGIIGSYYLIQAMEGLKSEKWAVILDPTRKEPLVAKRTDIRTGETKTMTRGGQTFEVPCINYGKWEKAEVPSEQFAGYKTDSRKQKMSEAQKRWWGRTSESKGLCSSYEPNARQFQIMPLLNDLNLNIMEIK